MTHVPRIAVLALGVWLAAAAPAPAGELTLETYESWRERILPGPEEAAYRDVGWLPVFWTAVLQAQREEKPILLWAMNGHPLACT